MAVLSCFALRNIKKLHIAKDVINSFSYACKSKVWNNVPVRNCHERTFLIKSSDFQYKQLKNLVHLYLLVGIVPIVAIITYINIFVGPATLALIPEGYEPKPWEYHRHPITRFFAKYVIRSPHELHERNLHNIFFDNEKKQLKKLRKEILKSMAEKKDYQAWYFDKQVVKYVRKMREDVETFKKETGISKSWIK